MNRKDIIEKILTMRPISFLFETRTASEVACHLVEAADLSASPVTTQLIEKGKMVEVKAIPHTRGKLVFTFPDGSTRERSIGTIMHDPQIRTLRENILAEIDRMDITRKQKASLPQPESLEK